MRAGYLLCALPVCGMLLAGCRQHRLSVAMIARTTASPIWEAAHAGAQAVAVRSRRTIYWNAPQSEDDFQKQAALVNRIVEEQYGGLIVAPDQPLAMTTSIQRAVGKGIKTVVILSPLSIPPRANLAYISNDNAAAGRMAATRVNEILRGAGSVAVLGVDPQSLNDLAILHAFEETVEERFPKIAIVDRRTGSDNQVEAEEIVAEELTVHPELNALFTLSAAASYGAITSLESRDPAGKIKLVGFEQSPTLVDRVRSGRMNSLIAEDTYAMGQLAMEQIAASGDHAMAPANIKLQPTLLMRENIDLPRMQQLVRLEWGVEP